MSQYRKRLAQDLLEHSGWMTSLARALVLDDARAEDAVQETYLNALRRPLGDKGKLGSWLASVLKNVTRKTRREEIHRRRREQAVARPERTSTSPEEAVERAEIRRLLIDLVLELKEPHRSTIVLRFFEELEPKDIAAQEDIDVSTV